MKVTGLLIALILCFCASASISLPPTLFMPSGRAEKLRESLTTYNAQIWARVVDDTKRHLRGDPPAYMADKGEQLWLRDVGNVLAQLAFVGYMANDAKYFKVAQKWAVASASYPTWGDDSTPDGAEHGLPYGHQLLALAMFYDYGNDYVDVETLDIIERTLLERTARQYASYKVLRKSYIQNHCWINVCGMLASAIVLQDRYPQQASQWIAMAQNILATTAMMLPSDGASQEGVGYWGYGVEWLLMANDLSLSLGNDYYKDVSWWSKSSAFSQYLTIPFNAITNRNNIIDLADSPRYAWYGPEHIYRRLAVVNNDSNCQWYAERVARYAGHCSWRNILWNSDIVASSTPVFPTLRHFNDMDIVSMRSDWSGGESVVVFKCGAPLGKSMANVNPMLHSPGDLGHVHPDAQHFVIFANGEYVVRNNGYVKRQTLYHNTLLVSGWGQRGEKPGYFLPFPLDASHDPFIRSVIHTDSIDVVIGDASRAYMEQATVERFVRKLIFLKRENMVVICDSVKLGSAGQIVLHTYTEFTPKMTGTATAEVLTQRNRVRYELLEGDDASMKVEKQSVAHRHGGGANIVPVIKVAVEGSESWQVMAISWSARGGVPSVAKIKRDGGLLSIVVNANEYRL